MRRRISLWALAGFVVASFWVIFGMAIAPGHNLGRSTLVVMTAPASLVGRSVPLAFYWFMLLNAAAYALLGLATELFRRPSQPALPN